MRSALRTIFAFAAVLAFIAPPVLAQTQVNASDLFGVVKDPSGALVPGVKVTVRNLATNLSRSDETDQEGSYRFLGLPPGSYEVSFETRGFAKLVNREVVLTIGQAAQFDATLQVAGAEEVVTVSEAAELIETSRTATSDTVTQRRIQNLPINGRNYINFTLTNSQAQRDSAPSIGAAPTSGINFGGQRARSNQVSVDGADAVDNSVNGIRATVSQEAVQEFQLIISNYMPEFGRATGGVINIVTKSGSNDVHGNVFGFLRHKSIQARNPFSVEVDPTSPTGLRPVKQAFTRAQAGATLGGPIKKDKSFYFFSYETTRRQETGFTNIGQNNFNLVSTSVPADLVPLIGPTPGLLTAGQATFVNITALPAALRAPYFALARGGSAVGLGGRPGIDRFATSGALLPLSFVGLNDLRGNYPVSEGTSQWSARLDHQWNQRNNSFVRVSVSPSLITGIQVNAQNQNFGQNAGSRTSVQQSRDLAIVGQHQSSFSAHWLNEARFQFARRGVHYGFSRLAGGDQVAVNIAGFAFFGREPFSTVDRIERRFQWTDNLSWIKGRHTFKFGGDINLVQLRSKKEQIFELNFGGLFNFGGLSASTFGLPDSVGPVTVPGFSAVQAYGLGIPSIFVQGIGNSNRPFSNKTFAFFIQDSWRVHQRLTFNYGVRYDVELTPLFAATTPLNVAAEAAFNVVEGIPRDKNNWSPRFAFAWDPAGNGNTVLRAGYGIFFDHPLLAVAFNSFTAEGALSTQLINFGGTPSAAPIANPVNAGAFNASSIFQGILNTTGIPGVVYRANEQRFDPKNSPLFNNQAFLTGFPLGPFPIAALPFTLPVAGNFVYGYAQQGNLTVEQKLAKDYKLGLSYTYTRALHLNRPRNINQPDPRLLTINAGRALGAGLTKLGSDPRGVVVPVGTGVPGNCVNFTGAGSILLNVPGFLGTGFATQNCTGSTPLGLIGTAAAFNFFRPSGPNPSFAFSTIGGFAGLSGIASTLITNLTGSSPTFAPVQVPWGDVDQQESSGNSVYHGLTVAVSKRFSRHFEFLSSYTWSHAIDDSTDLQTLLTPQDNRRPDLERSNSTFDQRHRWVTSAVFESPFKRTDEGWHRKFLADFIVAPIIEVASGRPFSVLTGTDLSLDFGSNTDRPSVASSGGVSSPFIPGVNFVPPTVCDVAVPGVTTPFGFGCTGNLGRNAFVRPNFFQWDLRVSRKFYFGEKLNLEFITDMFNLFNRFNVGDVSPLCNPVAGTCSAGEPTAALDPRQFQFGLKLNF